MTDEKTEDNKIFSYNFSQKSIQTELSLQDKAYTRLNVLYQISQLLSKFGSVEDTFPKILYCCSKTFPLLTAVLVDNWGSKPKTTIWHAESANHQQVVAATMNAREVFAYMRGSSEMQSNEVNFETATSSELNQNAEELNGNHPENYIVLPLISDSGSVIGVLQLEGGATLDEQDLEFVDAFAALITIALDRYYKTIREHNLQTIKTRESSEQLSGSQEKVAILEIERELREGFVSLLTHDLRTPLAAAKMAAQLILQQTGDPVASKELVDRIINNVNRADQMISNLLDANRLRSGESLPLHVEKVDLVKLGKDILKDLTEVYGDRFVLKAEGKIEGLWDPKGLRRMIENLANNAIKYGAKDSPVTLSLEQEKDSVWISVHNKGEVISPEDQKFIFKQYKRTGQAFSGGSQGWGIGLTLVRGVAEAHGGTVTVSSSVDGGTVFLVTLPKETKTVDKNKLI